MKLPESCLLLNVVQSVALKYPFVLVVAAGIPIIGTAEVPPTVIGLLGVILTTWPAPAAFHSRAVPAAFTASMLAALAA